MTNTNNTTGIAANIHMPNLKFPIAHRRGNLAEMDLQKVLTDQGVRSPSLGSVVAWEQRSLLTWPFNTLLKAPYVFQDNFGFTY